MNQLRFLFSSWKLILNRAVLNMRVTRIISDSGKCTEERCDLEKGLPYLGPSGSNEKEYDSFAKIWNRNIPGRGTACAKALRRKGTQGDKHTMNKKKGAADEVGNTGQPTSPGRNVDVTLRAVGSTGECLSEKMIRSKVSLQKITLAEETEMGWEEGMGWGLRKAERPHSCPDEK